MEPFTSAKRTITCLRSPSRALREVRIFSARKHEYVSQFWKGL
jgi:hypothetical protein